MGVLIYSRDVLSGFVFLVFVVYCFFVVGRYSSWGEGEVGSVFWTFF